MLKTSKFSGAALLAALFVCAGLVAVYVLDGRSPLSDAVGSVRHTEPLEIVTKSGVRSFQVEIARTPEEHRTGLMFRTSLADDAGMLFLHDVPQELSMWMRNTYIPLDMVFIRADGMIHRIEAKTQPMSEEIISSQGAVTAVLEIAGGAAGRLGIVPGDKVEHSFFQPPKP